MKEGDYIDQQMRFSVILAAQNAVREVDALTNSLERLRKVSGGFSGGFDDAGNKLGKFANGYKSQIESLQRQAERFYQTWKQTGDASAKAQFESLVPKIQSLDRQFTSFNRTLGISHDSMSLFGGAIDRMRSHFSWSA